MKKLKLLNFNLYIKKKYLKIFSLLIILSCFPLLYVTKIETFRKANLKIQKIYSKIIRNNQSLSEFNTSTQGYFTVANDGPILQDITRTFFFHDENNLEEIHFSTLEKYRSNSSNDRFIIYKYNLKTKELNLVKQEKSIEARSNSYSHSLKKYILGASLDPQILIYNPIDQSIKSVFHQKGGPWIHKIATKDDFAYFIVSSFAKHSNKYDGIVKVNLKTSKWNLIKFANKRKQHYGGVESIDPSGRIWFYREFPRIDKWYDKENGISSRKIKNINKNWTIKSWDFFGSYYYLILQNSAGRYKKKHVNIKTMEVEKNQIYDKNDELFAQLIPVDIFHQGSNNISSLYYDPLDFNFYLIDKNNKSIKELGVFNMKDIKIIGISGKSKLLAWKEGQKILIIKDFENDSFTKFTINAPNESPADIHSLVIGPDQKIYGSGVLTNSSIFSFNPTTDKVEILEQAIPDGEGQITNLINGGDGKIYGLGYPNSVPFSYDPFLAWDPGNKSSNNPFNLGKVDTYNQNRPDYPIYISGKLWYKSKTDYSYPIANALVRADFSESKLLFKTDLDDTFPIILGLARYDNNHLILFGNKNNNNYLYLLDIVNFEIVKERKLNLKSGRLTSFKKKSNLINSIYFSNRKILYKVLDDLSIKKIHKSIGNIERVLIGNDLKLILIGKSHIEMLDPKTNISEIWWSWKNLPKENVFEHLAYTPVIFYEGKLLIADGHKLKWFHPPKGLK